jgi:hypothetical protein
MTSVALESQLVHVKCNLCQGADTKYICHADHIAFVKCRRYGLAFLSGNSILVDNAIAMYARKRSEAGL